MFGYWIDLERGFFRKNAELDMRILGFIEIKIWLWKNG